MPRRIESITLERFKGATGRVAIDFDASKPVVIIFGENGTGKSTIVDAIDFVSNGKFGSIEERSTTGSTADLITALGSPTDTLRVEMNYAGNVWTGIIGHGRRPESTGGGVRPAVRILRRSEILKIVDGQPKDRYEALKSFINVPKTEGIEDTLRIAVKNTNDNLNEAVRAYQQAEQNLEESWEAEGKPDKDYREWAKVKSEVDVTALKKSIFTLNSIIQKMDYCNSTEKALSDAESTYKDARKTYCEAEKKYDSVRESIKGSEKDIVDVLEKAKDFLGKYPTVTSCPICEKPAKARKLTEKINKRLAALKSLIESKKVYESAKRQADDQKKILCSKKSDWINKVRDLAVFVKDSSIPEIDSLGIPWADFSGLLAFSKADDPDTVVPAATRLSEKLLSCKSTLELRKQKEDKEINQLNLVKTSYKTYTDKTVQARRLGGQLEKLKKLHESMEKERKSFVESELGSISGEVDNLYGKIHPEEGLGKVKFSLNPRYIGSLEFTGHFQGEPDVQPQAYYSESHLDTLGVCVFLALAKKYSDENTVVILDDVITSVDQVHMTRFIDMLHDEAGNFNQLIITTHYRPWKDRYKYYAGPTANIHLIELLHWSHPRGIRHTKAKLSVEELEEYLQDDKFDRQIVSSKAGILLEGLIDHIALRYNCKLPRKAEPDYTLSELLSSVENRLKKVLCIKKMQSDKTCVDIPIGLMVDEIGTLSWIRNQVGCHFKLEDTISDSDVKHFGELTARFARSFICDTCGELPYRDKSGSYWECRCCAVQMHPHKIPS